MITIFDVMMENVCPTCPFKYWCTHIGHYNNKCSNYINWETNKLLEDINETFKK